MSEIATESTQLLKSPDVTVTSDGIDLQYDSEGLHLSLPTTTFTSDNGRTSENHVSSLIPTDGPLHGRTGTVTGRRLSSSVRQLSTDGVDGPSTDASRTSLLSRQSTNCTASNYGTLCPAVRQKLNTLRRLSFTEVVARITLTWENIDVYVPPASSKPMLLRCLSTSSADSVQAKHILKDGMGHVQDNT